MWYILDLQQHIFLVFILCKIICLITCFGHQHKIQSYKMISDQRGFPYLFIQYLVEEYRKYIITIVLYERFKFNIFIILNIKMRYNDFSPVDYSFFYYNLNL